MTKVRIAIELEKTKNTFFLVPISKVARHYFIVFLNRHIVIDFIDVKPLMLNSFLSNFAVRNEYGIDLKINAMEMMERLQITHEIHCTCSTLHFH